MWLIVQVVDVYRKVIKAVVTSLVMMLFCGSTWAISVGTDNTCQFDNIQDAINSVTGTGTETIKVTSQKIWTEQLHISNKQNIKIIGQYVDCRHHTLSSVPTIISGGTFAGAVVSIFNSTNITLERMQIKNGVARGGMIINGSQVNLLYMDFINNVRNSGLIGEGAAGGGLSVVNNSDVSLFESSVISNQARSGGGIACFNSELQVINSTITGNKTINIANDTDYGRGGGIFVSNQCLLQMYSLEVFSGSTVLQISNNTASYYGGGIYADEASTVEINPNDFFYQPMPMIIANNQLIHGDLSTAGGGGLAAFGAGTIVDAYHLIFDGNNIDQTTAGYGAAIYLEDFAQFSMKVRHAQNNCGIHLGSTDNRCNQIINNKTLHPTVGAGVIFVSVWASAEIYQTYIAKNSATAFAQLVILLHGKLKLQGNIIVNNGLFDSLANFELFRVIGSFSELRVDFSTIADNYLFSGHVVRGDEAGLVALTRSIVDENQNIDVYVEDDPSNPGTTFFRCLLSHEGGSISGEDIIVDSPIYQPDQPYHLKANSPGVDMCNHSLGDLPPGNDIDGEERGECSGNCPDYRFDAGADEYSDVIFKHGFEF